ncbi:MAG: hypothetical protein IPI67_24085 [Myxococcales bacterium]|nr:hypothetical protein [Myxococcales bacterium]
MKQSIWAMALLATALATACGGGSGAKNAGDHDRVDPRERAAREPVERAEKSEKSERPEKPEKPEKSSGGHDHH